MRSTSASSETSALIQPADGELGAEGGERLVDDVADEDARAVAGEPPGDGEADPAGAGGDQHPLAGDAGAEVG